MRNKWTEIDVDSLMFDFPDFYKMIADNVKDGSTLVEVGLSNGKSFIALCEFLLNQGKSFRLVGIDNMDYGKHTQLSTIVSNISKADVGNYVELLALDSLQASCMFPDGSIDFVFLDSSHEYETTKAEIRCWIPKIKDGGILGGHDYHSIKEVFDAVNEVLPTAKVIPVNTDNNLGVWYITKEHKMLSDDKVYATQQTIRNMITETHSRIATSDDKDKYFKFSNCLNKVLDEIIEPNILK